MTGILARTGPPPAGDPAYPGRRRAVLAGAASGLLGAMLLTLLQAIARVTLGVASPAELLGDRIAPLLTIDQFFGLFHLLGSYNALKQLGVVGTVGGQLAVGVGCGMVYGLVARRVGTGRRSWLTNGGLTALIFLAVVVVLWPNLGTSYAGLPPGAARTLTIALLAGQFAVFACTLALTWRVLIARRGSARKGSAPQHSAPPHAGRRALLVGAAGVGIAAATGALGTDLFRRATFGYDGMQVTGPEIEPVTPASKFYTVTKNVIDPQVDPGRWRFALDGAVQAPHSWDLAELRALPTVTQETTLMCISNGVGGGLESNGRWTGIRLADLVAAAGPSPDAVEVLLTAVDGYTDTFAVAKAMEPTTLLAFELNGEPLPQRHGFPARIIVPGLFGEKNVKWVTRIELVTEETKGFYESQGWGPNFVIPTRSRIVAPTSDQPVRAGAATMVTGTAFAGDRGVSRVEVSTDAGVNWADATITYPGTQLTWALWSLPWQPAQRADATLVVRATDRTGAVQTTEQRSSVPQGATGLHAVRVAVR